MIPEREYIKALADNGLRISQAAKALYVSENAIRYNVKKISKNVGLNPLDFWDMKELIKRYGIEHDTNLTALEFMERQLNRCRMNHIKEKERGVPPQVLENIGRKIGYYEAAVQALKGEYR